MAERMKEIIQSCAKAVGTERIETENGTIDLFGEWKWVGVYPGLSEAVGVEITPRLTLPFCAKLLRSTRWTSTRSGTLRSW